MSAYIAFTRTKTIDQKELETYWAGIRATMKGHPIEVLVAYRKHEVLEGDPIEGIVIAKFPDVKAASISSALIREPASGGKPTVFTCAGDEAARSTVIALAKEIGFEGMDAGHLDASPNIENLGLLVGQLAYGSGFGNRVTLRAYVAPRPVRRARPGKGSTVAKRRRNP
jgi:uncharacterized protein (DUF1330 family)